MEYFENYMESDGADNKPSHHIPAPSLPMVNSSPDVSTPLSLLLPASEYYHPTQQVIYTNPKVESLSAAVQGPLTPLQEHSGGFNRLLHNHLTGHVEPLHVNTFSFNQQFNRYEATGIAANPADYHSIDRQNNSIGRHFVIANGQIGAQSAPDAAVVGQLTVGGSSGASDYMYAVNPPSRKRHRKKEFNDPSSQSFLGPWAPYISEEKTVDAGTNIEKNAENTEKNTETTSPNNINQETDETESKHENAAQSTTVLEKTTTIFHGKMQRDYQGKSWIEYPVNYKELGEEESNYIPKRHIFSYVGHTMGVQAIRFFPKSGHLLLSAGLDGQVKIWDVYNQRKCMRSYMGHSLGVRDVQFTHDGRQFYSCSYDKNILLWDTEYGKIIGTYSNGSTPYCVAVNPNLDQQNIFIIGSANKRAVQFDAKSGQIVQEYNEHLAAVNSVTFCEDGKKLVTTSDDKKIFIWDYGIPVVVKHIAEPSMHSMPSVCVHPSKKYFAAQSMDNQIVVYEAFGRFRYQGRKQFKGHVCAGYAIHPGFSGDGRYIMSGDASGKLWFWDWKNMKNYRTLQCHNGVCIDCAWHPTMTSRVATCGWDGVIKLWD